LRGFFFAVFAWCFNTSYFFPRKGRKVFYAKTHRLNIGSVLSLEVDTSRSLRFFSLDYACHAVVPQQASPLKTTSLFLKRISNIFEKNKLVFEKNKQHF
jgi:hypothetical protein